MLFNNAEYVRTSSNILIQQKGSTKRMNRPHKLEALERGYEKTMRILERGFKSEL